MKIAKIILLSLTLISLTFLLLALIFSEKLIGVKEDVYRVKPTKTSPKKFKSIKDGDLDVISSQLDWKVFNLYSEAEINVDNEYDNHTIEKNIQFPPGLPRSAAKIAVRKLEGKKGSYALYDIDGNNIDEIFVQIGSGSGGLNFIVLENQNGKWASILVITGQFILHRQDLTENSQNFNSDYYQITNWHQSGVRDTYQSLYAYKNKKYALVSTQNLPPSFRYLKDVSEFINNSYY